MNEMQLTHLYDFYFLEAMRAGISMAKSARPEIEFRHSSARLEYDIESTFKELTDTMAKRIRLYLFAAALGEARHAQSSYRKLWIQGLAGNSRKTVINNSNRWAIDETNTQILKDVFSQSGWGSSFGGKAWLNIVEAMDLYGKVSDATFIDHAVDLQHNGGTVFSKEAQNTVVNLNPWYYINDFLDLKFAKNILTHKTEAYLSGRVYRLLQRYSNIIEAVNFEKIEASLEWLTPFDVTMGNESLKTNKDDEEIVELERERSRYRGYYCKGCHERIDEDDTFSAHGYLYCESCYNENYSTCEKCDETIDNDDMVTVYTWKTSFNVCEECAKNRLNAAKCNDCGDWHAEYTIAEDTYEVYCENCAPNNLTYCEKCNENHEDIQYHNEHEHEDEYCKECQEVFEDKDELMEHNLENHYEPAELQEAEGFDNPFEPLDAKPPLTQIGQWKYRIWLNKDGLKIGEKENGEFSLLPPLVNPLGLWFGKKDTLAEAIILWSKVKDLLDWTKITSMDDWKLVPQETKSQIQKLAYGG